MKSPIDLLRLILTDCGNRCRVSTDRDFKRVSARFEREGYAFLGIALANYGKDLQKSLDLGFVAPDLFLGFKKRAGLPELFRGFLEQVFEPGSGHILPSPSVEAIQSLRQLSLMWAKLKDQTTPEREQAAFASYIEREKYVYRMALRIASDGLSGDAVYDRAMPGLSERGTLSRYGERSLIREFSRMSRQLFGPSFSRIDLRVYRGDIVPSHGPGSTADNLSGNQKWTRAEWNLELEHVFPISENYYSSHRFYLHDSGEYMEPGPARPVKVIAVPKTMEKPRIIAMEPTAMQYMQQGLKNEFEKEFEKPYLDGRINFSHFFVRYMSQIPNQEMARIGSRLGTLSTLDLSDASDSVSNLLVETMFSDYPHLREAIQATRSKQADVPGYGVKSIYKFASMGSALCFPIEALVFTTIVFLGIERGLGIPLTEKLIKSFIGQVRVYGDDIIVPTEFTHHVMECLSEYGFTVSPHKSFWTGKFRESCGKDYFDGEDVSIVRLRKHIPLKRGHVDELVSFVEFRNQLYKSGYWFTVKELDSWIEKLIPFPATAEGAPGLGKYSFLGYESTKVDNALQRPLVKAAVLVHTRRVSKLDGHKALLKWFQHKRLGNTEPLDKDHLQYAGRPVAVDIKHRWIHPDYGMDAAK